MAFRKQFFCTGFPVNDNVYISYIWVCMSVSVYIIYISFIYICDIYIYTHIIYVHYLLLLFSSIMVNQFSYHHSEKKFLLYRVFKLVCISQSPGRFVKLRTS